MAVFIDILDMDASGYGAGDREENISLGEEE
jgi:hypothetical protein